MSQRPVPPPPSSPEDDGVRVIQKGRTGRRSALPWLLFAVAVAVGVVLSRLTTPPPPPGPVGESAPAAAPATVAPAARATPVRSMVTELPNGDPNDLANYFRPGDPEPTGAELIGALNDVGIRTGIGAFNPPGTSPPLEGLAVPEDFELPEGYVRHYQSTDQGEAIEAILMFAPGFTLRDAAGRPVTMPENRVVPPGLAPPGLPPRRVRIPPPT